MKLLIDIGNTAMKFASSIGDKISYVGRFYTRELSNSKLDELFSSLDQIEEVYVSSVVPTVSHFVKIYFQKKYHLTPTFIKVGDYPKLQIEIDDPLELGVDLYADLAAGLSISEEHHQPVIIIDLGTATKLLLVNEKGVFSSCAIIPGIELSKKSLSNSTALLPFSELHDIKKVTEARNTIDVINSSVYYSHIDAINGLINRFEDETKQKCLYVITGGNAKIVLDKLKTPHQFVELLSLEGINKIIKG